MGDEDTQEAAADVEARLQAASENQGEMTGCGDSEDGGGCASKISQPTDFAWTARRTTERRRLSSATHVHRPPLLVNS